MKRRIAVVGDELSSGGRILDYEGALGFTLHGHKIALLGKEAFCTTCRSTGRIVKDGEAHRMDYAGTENALDGDIVLCACSTPPRIVATLAKDSWCAVKTGESGITQRSQSTRAIESQPPIYDEQFTLKDKDGRPLSGVSYRVCVGPHVVASGVTNENGKTVRITTDASRPLRLEVPH